MAEAGALVGRPVVKIRPGKGKRLAEGAPWAYADEIARDRRARKLAPGTIVDLVEGEQSLGAAAFNPDSQIAARLLDPDGAVAIDTDWLAARLARALSLRARLYPTPFYRLVHAEGDGLPGLVIDRFGETVAVQPNAAWIDRLLPDLMAAMAAVPGLAPQRVVVNAASRVRRLEGLEEHVTVARGSLDEPVEVAMNGAVYLADLIGGQKTGLFYDQRPNHAFVAALAEGARVLDVFAHVGGFGLAALAAGARAALAVDSSAPALALATEAAARMGVAPRFQTRQADAFDAMRDLAGEGARFDLVVCDPPAFAPAKQALAAGLRAYERVARLGAKLVEPGGVLVLCSCSHAADLERFRLASVRGILRAGRQGQLLHVGRAGPDHPSHLALPETSYLKVLVYRLDG